MLIENNYPSYTGLKPKALSRKDVLLAEKVQNNEFNDGSVWTVAVDHSISGGRLNIATAGTTFTYQDIAPMAVGIRYKISAEVSNYSAGTVQVYVGSVIPRSIEANANGVYEAEFMFTGVDTLVYIQAATGGFTGAIEYVSVKEIGGLVLANNMRPLNGVMPDISGNGYDGVVNGAISTSVGMWFNGVTDYIDYGNIAVLSGLTNVSWCFRFKSSDLGVNVYLFSQTFNGQTFNVRLNAGKLLAGVTGSSTIASVNNYNDANWHSVCLVLDGADLVLYVDSVNVGSVSDASALAISSDDHIMIGARGDNGAVSGFCECEVESAIILNRTISLREVNEFHNSYAKQVSYKDEFQDEYDGQLSALHWLPVSGDFEVMKQVNEAKYFRCMTAAAESAFRSKQAFGEWEFEIFKDTGSNTVQVAFISGDTSGAAAYRIRLTGAESLDLRRDTNTLLASANGYIETDTWYGIKIERTVDGEFSVFIRGGKFGNAYVLVDTTGGLGSNPVTDLTYSASEYFYIDFDSGDRIRNVALRKGVTNG